MTTQEVKAMIAEIGIPNAYYQFPEGTAQATPFACFFYASDNDLKADDSNYQKIEHLILEVYTDNKDFELEATTESVLASYGMVWSRSEEWIDSERMLEVIYEMEVVITEAEPEQATTENTEVNSNG